MGSPLLTIDEIRQVFWLLGECTELGVDPMAWRAHLAARLPEVIFEGFVNVVESPPPPAPGLPPPAVALGCQMDGPLPNENFELIEDFMGRAGEISPIIPKMLDEQKPANTRLRCELVPDRWWYRSSYYDDYVRALGLNDQLTSIDATAPKTISSICIHACGRETFTERHARMLEFLHEELTRLKHAGKLAPWGGFSLWDLSPRQRDVLCGLFAGDSEPQLARRLGISRHTVHDYVKALHHRFGVQSRGELMSRCAKFYPVLNRLMNTD